MKSAYNQTWLTNLDIVKDAKQWCSNELISRDQFEAIKEQYPSGFFHPNMIIRILLFIATLIALSGITGMLALMFLDGGEDAIWPLSVLYGLGSFAVLDRFFIAAKHHYKSGVTEALLYHSAGFTILGASGFSEMDTHVTLWISLVVVSFAAYRYLDLISTLIALVLFAFILFYELYEMGGIFQQIIPICFIAVFTPLYFLIRSWKKKSSLVAWQYCILVSEAFSLLVIYAAGNYLVVRELSVGLMDLYLEEGQDIPLAIVFYILTVLIPILYLYVGIRQKDLVMLRVSLLVLAFSVFTFKYYYSLGHPEITLTLAGLILIGISLAMLNYLKTPRKGYTRDNILSERWGNVNVEAFIIAQTMGGNKVTIDDTSGGGGGRFGGGGASGEF